MLLKIGFDVVKKHTVMFAAIVLQLIISIVLLNITIAMYNNVMARVQCISHFDTQKTLYYMAQSFFNRDDLQKLTKEMNQLSVEPVYRCGFVNGDDGTNILAYAYGEKTSEHLSYRLVSGDWYARYPKEEGIINAVAYEGSDFKVGDVYETNLYRNEATEQIKVKLRITGIVDKRIGVISGAGGSNSLETDFLFEDVDFDAIQTNNLFLLDHNDLLALGDVENDLFLAPNLFLYSDSEDTSATIRHLSDSGNILTIQSIIDNSSESLAQNLHTIYPVAFGVLFSGILGAECLIILYNIRNRRKFAIFYICGMKWTDAIKISVIQLSYVMLVTIPLVLTALMIIIKNNLLGFSDITMFEANNLTVTLAVILLMYAITILSTKLMVSSSSPKDYLKD